MSRGELTAQDSADHPSSSSSPRAPSPPLREVVPGLVWVKEHPVRLAGARFLTRMTVIRLDSGSCVHSPVEIDAPTRAAIEEVGPVRAIIAPSTFHHFFVASAQQAFPAARTYAVE